MQHNMIKFLTTNLAAMLRFKRRPSCLTGPASVIDGDTIVVAGELVRLHGIDAPELDQTFWWRGRHITCGTMALAALEALTAGTKVRCEAVERDQHGRLVAKCFSPNGVDIGRRLVSGAGRSRTDGTRGIISTPRRRPERRGAGCGGELS
jgi:endonuclease YncB( thermonuclease family)